MAGDSTWSTTKILAFKVGFTMLIRPHGYIFIATVVIIDDAHGGLFRLPQMLDADERCDAQKI